MLRLVANVLLFDTLGFLAIALVMSCTSARGEQTLLRFMRKKRFLILALFPWLPLLVWLEKPGRRLRRSVRRYEAYYLLGTFGVAALMLIGASLWDDGIVDCGMVVLVWVLLLDLLIRGGENNGGDDDHHDNEPPPDDPTPTGDAAERWLQSQQVLTDHASQPSSPSQ
jgi:hypothetical protein